MKSNIPKFYETDKTPFEDKVIYQRYTLDKVGFYWLVAEYDEESNEIYCYANLNNDQNAEWGYSSVAEIKENGGRLDENWKPCAFKVAQAKIRDEKVKNHLSVYLLNMQTGKLEDINEILARYG